MTDLLLYTVAITFLNYLPRGPASTNASLPIYQRVYCFRIHVTLVGTL